MTRTPSRSRNSSQCGARRNDDGVERAGYPVPRPAAAANLRRPAVDRGAQAASDPRVNISDRPLPAQVSVRSALGRVRNKSPGWRADRPYAREIVAIDNLCRDGRRRLASTSRRLHALLPHIKDDIRAQNGLQDFVANAPLNLVYVAHGERMTALSAEEARFDA